MTIKLIHTIKNIFNCFETGFVVVQQEPTFEQKVEA